MRKKEKGGGMIIGIFFLLVGVSILLKVVFNVDIPLVRTFIALFLIYLGVKMLFGPYSIRHGGKESQTVVFSESDMKWEATGENHYSVVFGKSLIDLTQVQKEKVSGPVEVNVVFGEATVLVDPKNPVKIRSNAVFGEAQMPDGNMVAFGSMNYLSPGTPKEAEALRIRGNVVFGSLKFKLAGEEKTSGPKSRDADEE